MQVIVTVPNTSVKSCRGEYLADEGLLARANLHCQQVAIQYIFVFPAKAETEHYSIPIDSQFVLLWDELLLVR